MIHLYPGNKAEGLLLLLNQISSLSPLGFFEQEVIVVENPGMQHWLNLEIAKARGISMNMRYALPAQFLWGLLRTLASEDDVPEQSPYLREVLTWRIYALLATKKVISDVDFQPATQYWCKNYDALICLIANDEFVESEQKQFKEETDNKATNTTNQFTESENLKRYQLAVQLADLYEQYLIFRPQWLDNWENGNFTLSEESEQSELSSTSTDCAWQGKLWRLLIEQAPYNPVKLLNNAINNIAQRLSENKKVIPARISFFGINSMAPMWLNFANALSEHVEVHFYHLNPCFAYWGDIKSEKEAIKQIKNWSEGVEDDHLFVGNPLLANLGQQGREFLSLLQDVSTIDVSLFVKASEQDKPLPELSLDENSNDDKDTRQAKTVKNQVISSSKSILHLVQDDILALEDATDLLSTDAFEVEGENNNLSHKDDSITIVSCHSALREVQALHDYLLHQFNDAVKANESLSPKDILVMCPQIEHYAPYVNAVFSRGWQDISSDLPPLPCSIADRSAKDSDPLIATFSDLLTLPNSRFQVSQLLSFMRLPAMANKFEFSAADLNTITGWINDSCIHWGLNLQNKSQILGEPSNAQFTWQQGLARLLRGFAYGDSDALYQSQLLLPHVEGDNALLLGRLILFIEQLQLFSLNLSKSRTAYAWQTFLLDQLNVLFSVSSSYQDKMITEQQHNKQNLQIENSLLIIHKAISGLVEYCEHAKFYDEIDLAIVVDYLTHHFSQGDSSKQFMVGQVTFCSMLPMRSIPFKVIAVLGLNDGDFPRQRVPLGFDLMANSKAILGDRSRRGDDRYLFLEALISARKSLYLSYQGRNIKNNSDKQPSIVLKELMSYLQHGYGWSFDGSDNDVKQTPMQAFSKENYIKSQPQKRGGNKASFDIHWLELAQKEMLQLEDIDSFNLIEQIQPLQSIEFDDLIKFFINPSKVFAQHALNLYLDNYDVTIDDVEPFSIDYLESYLLKQSLLTSQLQDEQNNISELLEKASISGKFPDMPNTLEDFDVWLEDNQMFSQAIIEAGCNNPETISAEINIPVNLRHYQHKSIKLKVNFPIKLADNGTANIVLYRASGAKIKDKLQLYFLQLMLQQWQLEQLDKLQETCLPDNLTKEKSRLLSLSNVVSSIGLYFNSKSKKVESFSVSDVEQVTGKLTKLLETYLQGHFKPLLLNAGIAESVFATKYGKPVELTQEQFETLWTGGHNLIGLKGNPYLNYFWPVCPNIDDYKVDIKTVYEDLFTYVIKDKQ
ncbi:MAG: exodeoxyribonuclease V subunit gamma [Colwellia sp.]